MIGFKEPYACAKVEDTCPDPTCQKFFGSMTRFYGSSSSSSRFELTNAAKSTAISAISSQYTILAHGGSGSDWWFTVSTASEKKLDPNAPANAKPWSTKQNCPASGTTITHIPTNLKNTWYPKKTVRKKKQRMKKNKIMFQPRFNVLVSMPQ